MPNESMSPDAGALALSAQLVEHISGLVNQSGGFLPFDVFMDAALYTPGLGYYSNGLTPFGAQGDFVTAPESGGLFARCLARSFVPVLQQHKASVLELGAGSGRLAADLLTGLQDLDALPERYAILERSPAMRAMQQSRIAQLPKVLQGRVEWVEELPHDWTGVIFGNEVADALPVKRFHYHEHGVSEAGIEVSGNDLRLQETGADPESVEYITSLARQYGWEGDYQTEYCPPLKEWVGRLADCLKQGLLLLIDYGYGRAEYYHPQRNAGTLMCHYRHQAHDNALWCPGLQDITAFVDFTSVAEAATEAGLDFAGYTSQARFLVGAGIDRVMSEADPDDLPRFLEMTGDAKRLMLPGEMGDRFKVIGFSRNLGGVVPGFDSQDLRSRL
ncbi:SAM-dependent MidA family methyltransferase [Thiogranum longum]|uniref:SAM-dependent MidA family methyltransferase n=1 Tax=Thiogranum longum TaxID=1537524 RepID=A0A4R1HJ55_9GAMM|nr:SAM-dependent methyltransferase [Thiogranum longum]TCK19539.1 SAM-dependent MidA family methyltransferase [Thiogranum longum]